MVVMEGVFDSVLDLEHVSSVYTQGVSRAGSMK